MSILVLGTVALDTVETPAGARNNLLGGSAVHFSMSARLFTDVHLVAVIGKDFPQRHIRFLHSKGLILDSLVKSQGRTFKWSGHYEGDLNSARTLNTELGVLLSFKPEISPRQALIKNVFLANIDPALQNHLLKKMRSPRLVALDSMNYWIHHKRKALLSLLKKVDIYVANDQEARDLSGESNLLKAAEYLAKVGPKMVLIKKGEHGVLFYSDKFIFSLPAYPVKRIIDPTGAGDTFAGGFMGYLAYSGKANIFNIRKALAFGTVAASFNIENFGTAKTERLTLGDLRRRLNEFRKITLF